MLFSIAMVAAAPRLVHSFREYVRFEAEAREQHEFVGGLILAMAGGTLEHAARTVQVIALIAGQLRGRPCRVFDGNARIRVLSTGNAYYPDASVIGGKLETDPEDELSATNPVVLVEVLSPSTADYDRNDKLLDYQRIPSVRHVVQVAHDAQQIDVWTLGDSGWTKTSCRAGERAELFAIECSLDVSEVYRDPLG